MSFTELVLAIIVLIDRIKGIKMPRIGTPLKVPELNLSPDPEGGMMLSDDMQQALSLLTAFNENRRILLHATPSGSLRVASARLTDVIHFTGSGSNDTQSGTDIKCSEVICMGHPDNAGMVWIRPATTATTTNALPLAAGASTGISIDNLRDLNMLFVEDGDILIVVVA